MTDADKHETATGAADDRAAPTPAHEAEPGPAPTAEETSEPKDEAPAEEEVSTKDEAPAEEEASTKGEAPADEAAPAKADSEAKRTAEDADEDEEEPEEAAAPPQKHTARAKPELPDGVQEALGLRRARKAKTPTFRRHEWWRYKKLGGKDAPWRRPTGTHSKQRRHFAYRPPVVSIGYGGPAVARGLHPSGFEEVLVHRPEDLEAIDPKRQAARVGGTVGGRKAEAIEKQADKLGIRVLNPRGEA